MISRKRWSVDEDAFLKENYLGSSYKFLSERMNRSKHSVEQRVSYLGLKKKSEMYQIKDMKIDERIYMAAALDCDGTIGVYKSNGNPSGRVGIDTTYEDYAIALRNITGLRLYRYRTKVGRGKMIRLAVSSKRRIKYFLEQVFPYLILKKMQAKTMLDWIDERISSEEAETSLKAMK